MSSLSLSQAYERDFWIDQYTNRRFEHVLWALAFAFVTVLCLTTWIFIGGFALFLAAVFEYLCFLAHVKFAFDSELCIEHEKERGRL